MKTNAKEKSIYYRFLFSYILIVLIPVIVFGVLFVCNYNKKYQQELISNIDDSLAIMATSLENEIKKTDDITSQVRVVVKSIDYKFEKNPLNANFIKQVLQTFVITSDLYDEIIYFDPHDEYLVSSRSTYSKDLFFSKFEQNGLQLIDGISSLTRSRSFLVNNSFQDEKLIYVVSPIIGEYLNPMGYVIFSVSDDVLKKYLKTYLEPYNASITISNGEDELFCFNAVPSAHDLVSFEYYIEELNWTISVSVPLSYTLLMELNKTAIVFFALLVLVSVFSAFAILYFMRVNYRPLDRLHKKVSDFYLSNSKNEFEAIDRAIDNLSAANKSLFYEVRQLQTSAKNLELQKLITGGFFTTREDFNRKNTGNIRFENEYFAVACLLFNEGIDSIEIIAAEVEKKMSEVSDTFYIFTPIPRRLYLIFNSKNPEIASNLYEELELCRKGVEIRWNCLLTIGCSGFEKGIEAIPGLFLKARTALDYRFIKGKGSLICSDSIMKNEIECTQYPSVCFDKLKLAIANKEDAAVETELKSFIEFIGSNNVPLFFAKGLCFEIFQTFIRANPNLKMQEDYQQAIFSLSDVDTASELVSIIRDQAKALNTGVEEFDSKSAETLTLIKAYIKDNYLSCNYSIQELASYCNMNVSKLSVFFKEAVGVNLIDYVSGLRMEKAKELLTTTDKTTNEISLCVGYYNVSSFIRRFKQIEGVTPGEYKRIHGGE